MSFKNPEESLSFTGYKFKKATPLNSLRKMPPMSGDTIKVMMKFMGKEVGLINTLILLFKSWVIDLIFSPPRWNEKLFIFDNEKQKKLYRNKFKSDGLYLIPVFNNLKKKFGEVKANEIMARVTIIASIPFLSKVFQPIPDIKHIDEFRQQMSDYLGGIYDEYMEEWVSEDNTEVRYRFNRCPHIEIWKAYGAKSLAAAACMADHVVFDNIIPQLVFSRTCTIGVGDNYCDHIFRIRQPLEEFWEDIPEQCSKDQEDRYKDAYKCTFKAREEIRKWRHRFLKNGNKFNY